jgi:pantothenate kinase-related protein Tda10
LRRTSLSRALLPCRSATGAKAAVPLYDKSLRGGRGDRAPEAAWPVVTGPLQVVCLEGWCLGFRPLATDAAAAAVHPGLGAVNAALRTYEAAMESRVDAWVVVRVAEPNWVFDWRLQAEVEMRKSGKAGLTDAQVADFVSRFMPAYKAYLPVRAASRARARMRDARARACSQLTHAYPCRASPVVLQGRAHRAVKCAAAGARHRRHAHAHRRTVGTRTHAC